MISNISNLNPCYSSVLISSRYLSPPQIQNIPYLISVVRTPLFAVLLNIFSCNPVCQSDQSFTPFPHFLYLVSYQVLHIFILNHLSHSIQNFHILSQGLPESFFLLIFPLTQGILFPSYIIPTASFI